MTTITYRRVDHIAVAVEDLDAAIDYYQNALNMPLIERRETKGRKTGMVSAVMDGRGFKIVLVQGTSEDSQVSRYLRNFGPGVQHVAFEVDGLEESVEKLRSLGMEFSTELLRGEGLKQIFSKRDPCSGMMYELIERVDEEGFQDANVTSLFEQLEASDSY